MFVLFKPLPEVFSRGCGCGIGDSTVSQASKRLGVEVRKMKNIENFSKGAQVVDL